MAQEIVVANKGSLLVRNVGLMLSGDLARPILDADALLAIDGVIRQVGKLADIDSGRPDRIIDANGSCLAPGLIDSHVHPVFGDWTPRQNQLGWIDSCLHGGVTSMISAGEVHLPGRPKDIVGLKALAITAQRAFHNFRPGGVKVLAGAPVLEQGLVEADFAELAAAGVTLLGEVGLGSVKAAAQAREMVGWARKYGIQSTIHTGGPSIPGSGLIDKDVVLEADADVIGHINGGHTALPEAHVCELCERSTRTIEIVHNGNEKVAIAAAQTARDLGCLQRVILGTDAPAGSGAQPLGILRLIALLASLGGIPAELAFCFATGNTARLRGLNGGLLEPGRAADLVFLDRAQESAGRDLLDSVRLGDLPGVGMVIIDGIICCTRSRNTPPATRVPALL
jgi:enamidase